MKSYSTDDPFLSDFFCATFICDIYKYEQLCVQPGFPGSSAGKESACNTGDPGSIPGLGRFPGEGKGYPLQYSGLENSMNCIIMESQELDTTTLGNYKKVSNFANSHKAKIERSGFWIKFVFGRPIPLCQAVVC